MSERRHDVGAAAPVPPKAQEAFLQNHLLASAHLGAVSDRIKYANLKPAVAREPRGRDRQESERVAAIVDHVTFNLHILGTGTESYWLRTRKTSTRRKRTA